MTRRAGLHELEAFAAVAQARSFTRAAARLRVSQSALSHSVRKLEERLGVRLLARTTRSVAPTPAGERLLATLAPAFSAIDAELALVTAAAATPIGTIRLTVARQGYATVVQPVLTDFLRAYPGITLDLALDDGLTDIVADGFDAGIRLGGLVEKDMVAIRIGPEVAPAVVAAPAYLAARTLPEEPRDLYDHRCINYRLLRGDAIYAWQFQRGGERITLRVDGPLTLNDGDAICAAALDAAGIAYLWWDQVQPHVQAGRLVRLLADWCPAVPGYHLYHSSRRQMPPALKALVTWLRNAATVDQD